MQILDQTAGPLPPDMAALAELVNHPLLLIEIEQLGIEQPAARLEWANQAALEWMQISHSHAMGQDIGHLPPFSSNPDLLANLLTETGLSARPGLVPVESSSGKRSWVRCLCVALSDQPGNRRFGLCIEDRSEPERQRRDLAQSRYRDLDTGLRNRRSLLEALQNLPPAQGGCSLTLFQLEAIDCLEMSLGPCRYADLLRQVSQRFTRHAEGAHYYLGQGLFALLKRETALVEDVHQSHAKLIQTSLCAPYALPQQMLHCRFRIGSACYLPGTGRSAQALPMLAQNALNQAGSRKNPAETLSDQEATEYQHCSEIGLELVRLDRRISFSNYYQPQVDLHSNRLIGFEVLGRYQLPPEQSHAAISPERFFALASRLNLMNSLDLGVLHRLLRQHGAFAALGPIQFSVNAVPSCLEHSGYVQALIDAKNRLPKHLSLEVEITENELALDSIRLCRSLQRLREAGVGVALDDFGSGLSNLHYLVEMPFSRVKLDRSLVCRIDTDQRAEQLLRACAEMCHRLELPVLAEGIENAAQAEVAKQAGCQAGQGYFWSKPLPVETLFASTAGRGWLDEEQQKNNTQQKAIDNKG